MVKTTYNISSVELLTDIIEVVFVGSISCENLYNCLI